MHSFRSILRSSRTIIRTLSPLIPLANLYQPFSKFTSTMDQLRSKAKFLESLNPEFREAQLVVENKNNCLYVKDSNNEFGFLSEASISSGVKGVVVDIRDKIVGIAMYEGVEGQQIKAIESSQHLAKYFPRIEQFVPRSIYDVNQRVLQAPKDQMQKSVLSFDKQQQSQSSSNKETRIPVLDPMMYTCHDIRQGSFTLLEGCYGTGKTATLFQIIKGFHQLPNSSRRVTLYMSFNIKDCEKLLADNSSGENKILCFSENNETRSDAGGLFLAYKVANLAETLRKKGYDVLVAIENFNEVLRREVSLFNNFGQPIAPFSVVNQLFCSSNFGQAKTITTILTVEEESEKNKNRAQFSDQTQAQSTPYVNSLTHLYSLALPIKFPLTLTLTRKIQSDYDAQTLSTSINKYLQFSREFELKSKLKLNHEPYQNYFLLDADWWVPSLKTFKPNSMEELQEFVRFLEWNINNDTVANWKLKAHVAFQLLQMWKNDRGFVATKTTSEEIEEELFEWFVGECRLQDVFSPYKRDYLA